MKPGIASQPDLQLTAENRSEADRSPGEESRSSPRGRGVRDGKQRHILILHQAPWFGGAEKRIVDWLRGIDYDKCRVTLTDSADVFTTRVKNLGLPVDCKPLKLHARGPFLQLFRDWAGYLRTLQPDQVVLIDGYFLEWPLAVALAAFCVSRGNLYMTEHTPAPDPVANVPRTYFGFLPGPGIRWRLSMWQLRARARVCRRVLAVSEHLKEWIVRNYHYSPAKIVVAHHGVETWRFQPPTPEVRRALRHSFALAEGEIAVVSTARLHRDKRVDRLVQAFAALATDDAKLRLLLAGDGPEEEKVQQLAQASGASEKIKWLGWLEDVSPLLQAGDVYVLSSDLEGFGVALLEAMASELVCVVTKTQGPAEIIVNGKNGFLVEPTEAGLREGLACALRLPPEERRTMGQNARQTVLEQFSFQEGVKRGLRALNIAVADGRVSS